MLRTRYRKLLLTAIAPLAILASLAGATLLDAAAAPLRVNGSTTINPVVVEASNLLRAEQGLAIQVDTQGGSSGGMAALGEHRAEIAMVSRPLVDEDHVKYPKARFVGTRIGLDGVALIVSRDLWEGGIKALTKAQVRGLYEGKIKNWKEIGGPNRRVVFFNKEAGRGTWEVFAHWVYGDPGKAPLVSLPEVGANEEARSKVSATPGSISQLSAAWADNRRIFAVGLKGEDGKVLLPTPAAILDGSYPLSRPLQLVTDGPPQGAAKVLIDLVMSPRGQALVRKNGYQPIGKESGH
jgi:phosphate transport system substrate-binding protein